MAVTDLSLMHATSKTSDPFASRMMMGMRRGTPIQREPC
jgi:hypothetical protein